MTTLRFSKHIQWWSPEQEKQDYIEHLELLRGEYPDPFAQEQIDSEIRRVQEAGEFASRVSENPDGRLVLDADQLTDES